MSDFVKLNWEFYMENRTTHHMRLGISAVGYIYGIEIRPSRKSKVQKPKILRVHWYPGFTSQVVLQPPFLPSPQNLTAQFCRVARRRKLVGIDIVRQGLGMRTSQRQIVGDRPPVYGKVHGEIRHENMKTRSLGFRILTRALGYLLVDSTQKNMGRWGSSSHSSLKRKRRCLKPPVKRSGQWTVVHQPEMQELLCGGFPYEPPSMVTSI